MLQKDGIIWPNFDTVFLGVSLTPRRVIVKATEAELLQILSAVSQFIIPIDQRTYSWTQKEYQQLWADILRAGSSNSFLASVLLLLQ